MKKLSILLCAVLLFTFCGCTSKTAEHEKPTNELSTQSVSEQADEKHDNTDSQEFIQAQAIQWNEDWEYAEFSQIHSASVNLYKAASSTAKNITVCVNAGHGTKNGSSYYTYCHPDKTPKVTGGSTAEGSLKATAVSEGTTMLDGTPEAKLTLSLAFILKEKLLENGYDVLMIRENDDTQLDNIARTVFADNNADCHVSLHYDSTENDKGLFYLSVPESASYRAMEPVASHYREHLRLGDSILEGAKAKNIKIFSSGKIPIDLTQTSYSTVPSVDVEVGDRASDYSYVTQEKIAEGIALGIDIYFKAQ